MAKKIYHNLKGLIWVVSLLSSSLLKPLQFNIWSKMYKKLLFVLLWFYYPKYPFLWLTIVLCYVDGTRHCVLLIPKVTMATFAKSAPSLFSALALTSELVTYHRTKPVLWAFLPDEPLWKMTKCRQESRTQRNQF